MSRRTKTLKRILKKKNNSNGQYIKVSENGVSWKYHGQAKAPSGAQIYLMSMSMNVSKCDKCGAWTVGEKTIHSQEDCNKELTKGVVDA